MLTSNLHINTHKYTCTHIHMCTHLHSHRERRLGGKERHRHKSRQKEEAQRQRHTEKHAYGKNWGRRAGIAWVF